MREWLELQQGKLEVESGLGGTQIRVFAPNRITQ
jgi:hypothetical protein